MDKSAITDARDIGQPPTCTIPAVTPMTRPTGCTGVRLEICAVRRANKSAVGIGSLLGASRLLKEYGLRLG